MTLTLETIETILTPENAAKKFAIFIGNNPALSEQVQKHLFDKFDASWLTQNDRKSVQYTRAEVLFVNIDSGYYITYGNEHYLNQLESKGQVERVDVRHDISLLKKTNKVVIDGVAYDGSEILKLIKNKGLDPL